MSQTKKRKNLARLASIALLLTTMTAPWFADSHPATEKTCLPPLVWLRNGYCACLIPFTAFAKDLILGHSSFWLLFLPPVLPILSAMFLLALGERRWLWLSHLGAWALTAGYSFLWFFGLWYLHQGILILPGAGLGGLIAFASLVWEILLHRRATRLKNRPRLSAANPP